ncbi:hypothetical protein ACJX0J_027381, partial [Zea mays]
MRDKKWLPCSLLVVVEFSRLETLIRTNDLIAMDLSTRIAYQIARLGRKRKNNQQANNPITFLKHRTGSLDLDDKIWLDSFLNLQRYSRQTLMTIHICVIFITCYFHFMLKCHEQLLCIFINLN